MLVRILPQPETAIDDMKNLQTLVNFIDWHSNLAICKMCTTGPFRRKCTFSLNKKEENDFMVKTDECCLSWLLSYNSKLRTAGTFKKA